MEPSETPARAEPATAGGLVPGGGRAAGDVHGGLGRGVALAGVLLALAVATMFAVLTFAVDDLRDTMREADRATDVILAADELQRLTLDAQRGGRGFVVTRREEFLEPYERARSALGVVEQRLRAAAAEAGVSSAEVEAVIRSVERYVFDFSQRVVSTGRRSPAAGRAIVATGEGKRRVDQITIRVAGLTAGMRESAGRDERRADDHGATAMAVAIGSLLASLALVTVFVTYVARRVIVPIRRVAAAARRVAEGDLGARVADGQSLAGEPGAMARAFNAMADTLERSHEKLEAQKDELEAQGGVLRSNSAELEAKQAALEESVDALEVEKARMNLSYGFGHAVAGETRFKPLADTVLERIADHLSAELGLLYVRDARREWRLALTSARGVHPGEVPEIVDATSGLAGRALAERRPVTAQLAESALRVHAYGRELPVRHEVHVPLVAGDEVLGVISLGRLGGTGFDERELELAGHLADQAGVALAKIIALRDADRRGDVMRVVLDAVPMPIGLFDEAGSDMLANEPMRRLVAELGEDVVPATDGEADLRDELAPAGMDRVFQRYTVRLDVPEDQGRGRLVVLRDVTAEREAQQAKDSFLALVSHELRTPLTSVIGYVELLRDEAARPAAGDEAAGRRAVLLEIVERNAGRLLRLVDDLLLVAQAESGHLALERDEVDLAAVARHSVEAARLGAEQRGVTLALAAQPVPVVSGDRDRLAQAVDNLLSNAVKFTPEAGTVTVATRRAGDRVVVEVSDTGAGIAVRDRERLFEPFFRSDRATAAAIPGVGLGLSIVRSIVESHRGRIVLDSTPGAGSTFGIEVPVAEAEAEGRR